MKIRCGWHLCTKVFEKKKDKVYCNDKCARYDGNKKRRTKTVVEWVTYFALRYGSNPKCEVCKVHLSWEINSNNKVCFDHRLEGKEAIKGNPSNWYSIKMHTEKNKQIWESCDFGILCIRCNITIPTHKRKEWYKQLGEYLKKE